MNVSCIDSDPICRSIEILPGFLLEPSVGRLARILGWSTRETRGALVELMSLCLHRRSYDLEAEDIDIVLGHDGFADALVAIGFATETAGETGEGLTINVPGCL
jgi:hypothetical protein